MTQPTPYKRQADFVSYQTNSPNAPMDAGSLDSEFNALKVSLDQLLANLALIQRDDTELGNNLVGADQLKSELMLGVGSTSDWLTGTNYKADSLVWESSSLYRCVVEHTSGTFATDLAAGYWVVILDFSNAVNTTNANVVLTNADVVTTANSVVAAQAAASQTATDAAQVNNDANTAIAASLAAALSETNAQASEQAAALSAASINPLVVNLALATNVTDNYTATLGITTYAEDVLYTVKFAASDNGGSTVTMSFDGLPAKTVLPVVGSLFSGMMKNNRVGLFLYNATSDALILQNPFWLDQYSNVHLSAGKNISNIVGFTVVPFDSVLSFSSPNFYKFSGGVFRWEPIISGQYVITASVLLAGLVAGDLIMVGITKNGVRISERECYASGISQSFAILHSLNVSVGDVFSIVIQNRTRNTSAIIGSNRKTFASMRSTKLNH